jgi:hypothetical protein
MKLRTRHLFCMLLLLSALRAADGAMLPSGQNGFDAHYLSALLSQDGPGAKVTLNDHRINLGSGNGHYIFAGFTHRFGDDLHLDLPVGSLASYRTAWTMRPPSEQTTSVHTVTGLATRVAL